MGHHPNSPKHVPHHQDQPDPANRRHLHKDWRIWVGVLLMLIAIGTYLITMDESLPPEGAVKAPVPAMP
jgi:hypothetical protein